MVTLTTHVKSRNSFTALSRNHFDWANATFVAEHNIISAIVLCIQKVASETTEHSPIFVI